MPELNHKVATVTLKAKSITFYQFRFCRSKRIRQNELQNIYHNFTRQKPLTIYKFSFFYKHSDFTDSNHIKKTAVASQTKTVHIFISFLFVKANWFKQNQNGKYNPDNFTRQKLSKIKFFLSMCMYMCLSKLIWQNQTTKSPPYLPQANIIHILLLLFIYFS